MRRNHLQIPLLLCSFTLLCAAAPFVSAQSGSDPVAQSAASPPVDTLAIAVADLRAIIPRFFVYNTVLGTSAVHDCQIGYARFCVAEHITGNRPNLSTLVREILPDSITSNRTRLIGLNTDSIAETLRQRAQVAIDVGMRKAEDNGWFAGQAVLASLVRDDFGSAQAALRGCRSSSWWCAALRGLVANRMQRYTLADSLFDYVLQEMPESESCDWRDISPLLDRASRNAYRALSCNDRRSVEDKIWWLADPLYVLEGNDRRSEHYSRRVIDSLMRGAESPFHYRHAPRTWSADLSDMLVRFGAEGHYIRTRDNGVVPPRSALWMHLHIPNYHFLPVTIPSDTTELSVDLWNRMVRLNEAPERYHPPYGYVGELEFAQVVTLPRGDSMLVLAATDMKRNAMDSTGPFLGALAVTRGPDSTLELSTRRGQEGTIRLEHYTSSTAALLGLEVLSHDFHVAGRTRFAINPPARPGDQWLSELIFYEPGADLPRTTREASQQMLGRTEFLTTAPVGLYWEVYGLTPDVEITYEISIYPLEVSSGGLFGRLGRLIGLNKPPAQSTIGWKQLRENMIERQGHAIVIDLDELREGTWLVELTGVTPTGSRSVTSRTISVIARPPAPRSLMSVLAQEVPEAEQLLAARVTRREVGIPR